MKIQPHTIDELFEITHAGPAHAIDPTEPSHIHIPRPSRANRSAAAHHEPDREARDQPGLVLQEA